MKRETKEILMEFRNGEEGYYVTLNSLMEKYTNGFICIDEVDNAIHQLREDFDQAKNFGWNNAIWRGL